MADMVTKLMGIIEGEGPVGLSFIGWAGGDEALLDLVGELERFCDPRLIDGLAAGWFAAGSPGGLGY